MDYYPLAVKRFDPRVRRGVGMVDEYLERYKDSFKSSIRTQLIAQRKEEGGTLKAGKRKVISCQDI